MANALMRTMRSLALDLAQAGLKLRGEGAQGRLLSSLEFRLTTRIRSANGHQPSWSLDDADPADSQPQHGSQGVLHIAFRRTRPELPALRLPADAPVRLLQRRDPAPPVHPLEVRGAYARGRVLRECYAEPAVATAPAGDPRVDVSEGRFGTPRYRAVAWDRGLRDVFGADPGPLGWTLRLELPFLPDAGGPALMTHWQRPWRNARPYWKANPFPGNLHQGGELVFPPNGWAHADGTITTWPRLIVPFLPQRPLVLRKWPRFEPRGGRSQEVRDYRQALELLRTRILEPWRSGRRAGPQPLAAGNYANQAGPIGWVFRDLQSAYQILAQQLPADWLLEEFRASYRGREPHPTWGRAVETRGELRGTSDDEGGLRVVAGVEPPDFLRLDDLSFRGKSGWHPIGKAAPLTEAKNLFRALKQWARLKGRPR